MADRHTSDSGFPTVKPKKKRRQKNTPSRRRAEARRTIERVARDRHQAWTQTGVPVAHTVHRLTQELDSLYDDKRREERGP